MPLPKPKLEEKEATFISRCMSENISEIEFPNTAQRVAVCQSLWDNKENPKNEIRKNDKCPDGWEHSMPDGKFMCGKTMKEKTYAKNCATFNGKKIK